MCRWTAKIDAGPRAGQAAERRSEAEEDAVARSRPRSKDEAEVKAEAETEAEAEVEAERGGGGAGVRRRRKASDGRRGGGVGAGGDLIGTARMPRPPDRPGPVDAYGIVDRNEAGPSMYVLKTSCANQFPASFDWFWRLWMGRDPPRESLEP